MLIREIDDCNHNTHKFIKYFIIDNIIEVNIYADMNKFNIDKSYLCEILNSRPLLYKSIREIIKYCDSYMEIDKSAKYYKIQNDLYDSTTHKYVLKKVILSINHYNDNQKLQLKNLLLILKNDGRLKANINFFIDDLSKAKGKIYYFTNKLPSFEIVENIEDINSLSKFLNICIIFDKLYRKGR